MYQIKIYCLNTKEAHSPFTLIGNLGAFSQLKIAYLIHKVYGKAFSPVSKKEHHRYDLVVYDSKTGLELLGFEVSELPVAPDLQASTA